MLIILLVILLVLSLGSLPSWPYSRELGLLSEWRPRSDRNNSPHPSASRQNLEARAVQSCRKIDIGSNLEARRAGIAAASAAAKITIAMLTA